MIGVVETMDEVLDIALEQPLNRKSRKQQKKFVEKQQPPQIEGGERPEVH